MPAVPVVPVTPDLPEPDLEPQLERRDRAAAGPRARRHRRAARRAGPAPPLRSRPPPVDLPTQAGMPVFHDDDEVDWLRARAEKPEPPPPLEDPPPKPLFAPDPPDGEPVRRPRPGSRAASGNPDYWPWDASSDSSRDSSIGASLIPACARWAATPARGARRVVGGPLEHRRGLDDTGDQVPGRSWFRLAMIVGICVVVMVAAVAAYQLGLPTVTDSGDDDPTTSASPSPTAAAPTPFTGLVAAAFDPQGTDGGEENSDSAPNVVDGDATTSWSTSTYEQNFGPAGLKTGVGLVVDLGATKGVRQVTVSVDGETSLAAYVTSTAPTGVAGLTPIGTASGSGDARDLGRRGGVRTLRHGLAHDPAPGPRRLPGHDLRGAGARMTDPRRPTSGRTGSSSRRTSTATPTRSACCSRATATGSGRWRCARWATPRTPPTASRTA